MEQQQKQELVVYHYLKEISSISLFEKISNTYKVNNLKKFINF